MQGVIYGALWASGIFLAATLILLAWIEVLVLWDTFLRERRRRKALGEHTRELIRRGR